MSFWDEAAGKPQVEGGGDFEDLPAKIWYKATTTTEENGGAKPQLRTFAMDDGEAYQFNIGLIAEGAEFGKVDPKFDGRFCFFSAWVTPNKKNADATDKDNYISGRLTGFLNAIYAPGVALEEKDKTVKAQLRWQATMKALQKIAGDHGMTQNDFPDDPGLFIASVALADMQQNGYKIIFKTNQRKWKSKKDNKEGVSIEAGAYEDCVEANLEKRKIVSFDAMEAGSGGSTGTAF